MHEGDFFFMPTTKARRNTRTHKNLMTLETAKNLLEIARLLHEVILWLEPRLRHWL
jgi:hypothetical protein